MLSILFLYFFFVVGGLGSKNLGYPLEFWPGTLSHFLDGALHPGLKWGAIKLIGSAATNL
jgi:hypothetical protein